MKSPISQISYVLGVLFTLTFSFTNLAQVGIGTTSPNTDALLDVDASSTTGGILLPRIALTSTSSPSPLSADVAGMIVYNTATAGDVTPGFYYNDGSDWFRLGAGTASDDWTTTGNSGTTAGTNFLGTTDNVSLELFTNNTTRMRVENDGQVTIGYGASAASAGYQFSVEAPTNNYAIIGNSSGTGRGVYGISTLTGQGVRGYNDGTGYGVAGNNAGTGIGVLGTNASTGVAVYGLNSGTGTAIFAKNTSTGTGIVSSGNNGTSWNLSGSGGTFTGSIGALGLTTSATGTGLSGVGNAGTTSQTLTNGSGVAGSGDTGLYGRSTSTSGTGIIGVGNNNSVITTHSKSSGIAGTGSSIGVFGYAGNGDTSSSFYGNAGGEFVLDADNDPTTNTGDNGNRARAILAGFNNVTPDGSLVVNESYYGGYFSGGSESSGTPTYAYVGMRYRTNSNGDGVTTGGGPSQDDGQDYKIIGTGLVSTLINDSQGKPRVMFAPEAPEIVFQDFGIGTLVNGIARIDLDPILKGSIYIDNEHPLKVYVTLEGECNGIYVTNKSTDGFTVKELQGGTSNVSFSWQIVANRADTKSENGTIVSKHVGVRLPVGPGPLTSKLKKLETTKLTAKEVKGNSIDRILSSKLGTIASETKK